jgi:hypothetical protein
LRAELRPSFSPGFILEIVLHCNPRPGKAIVSSSAGPKELTCVPPSSAVLGLHKIRGGVYSFVALWNERATLRLYAITIGMIGGGLIWAA